MIGISSIVSLINRQLHWRFLAHHLKKTIVCVCVQSQILLADSWLQFTIRTFMRSQPELRSSRFPISPFVRNWGASAFVRSDGSQGNWVTDVSFVFSYFQVLLFVFDFFFSVYSFAVVCVVCVFVFFEFFTFLVRFIGARGGLPVPIQCIRFGDSDFVLHGLAYRGSAPWLASGAPGPVARCWRRAGVSAGFYSNRHASVES